MPLLPDPAGDVDLELPIGSLWQPTWLNLVEGAVDENGTVEPFEAGTVAYMTIRDEIGGTALIDMGPDADALDGTLTVTPLSGLIEGELLPLKSLGLAWPSDGSPGVYDLVIYPGGDEDRAYALTRGVVIPRYRSTERPAAPAP